MTSDIFDVIRDKTDDDKWKC